MMFHLRGGTSCPERELYIIYNTGVERRFTYKEAQALTDEDLKKLTTIEIIETNVAVVLEGLGLSREEFAKEFEACIRNKSAQPLFAKLDFDYEDPRYVDSAAKCLANLLSWHKLGKLPKDLSK